MKRLAACALRWCADRLYILADCLDPQPFDVRDWVG